MIDILFALLDRFGISAEVVVALGQAEAAGAIEADDLGGVGIVLVGAHAEECVDADVVQVAQQGRQFSR